MMKHGYIGEFEVIDDHRAGKICQLDWAPQQVRGDLSQVRCCHRRDREVDQQPPALQTVWLCGADHLRRHHGPRGGQKGASWRKDPGILLPNTTLCTCLPAEIKDETMNNLFAYLTTWLF